MNITINLGGNEYTVTAPTVGSSGTETNGFQFLKGSKVTIKNGTIVSDLGNLLIQNYSNLTLEDVTITATNADYVMSNNCGEVNITGATSITAGEGKYAFDVCATDRYPEGVTVNVNTKGTITGNIKYGIWDNKPENNQAKMNVMNGNFEGQLVVDSNLADDAKKNFEVTGGTFSDETFAPYLPAGNELALNEETGKYELAPAANSVAVIGNKGYTSLEEAVIKANAGDFITLKQSVELTDTIEVNKDLTIDLGANNTITGNNVRALWVKEGTLTLTGTGTVKTVAAAIDPIVDISSVIRVGDGGNYTAAATKDAGLVIDTNVTIEAPATYGVSAFGGNTNESVTVKGKIHVTGECTAAALAGNGNDKVSGTTFVIEDGAEVTSEKGLGIYHPQAGTLTVNGGTISGITGIEMKAGTLTVNGGTITGTAAENHTPNSGAPSTEGFAVAIVENNAYAGTPTANLKAGTYDGKVAVVSDNPEEKPTPAGKEGDINITGGTYDNIDEVKEYIAPGYKISASGKVTKKSSGGGSSATSYAVIVDSVKNGDVTVSPKNAAKGTTVTITVEPKDGYELDELTVTDANGKTVKATEGKNGKYTFTMPESKVTVEATFAKTGETTPVDTTDFTDVKASAWYAEAVQYVADKGMMKGTDGNNFSPNDNTTRGQIVTVLYRLENEPAAGTAAFTDVAAGQYYAKAVAWAADKEVVKGYTETTFGPNDSVTREQIAAILFRYADFKGIAAKADGNLTTFTDAAKVSTWAEDAMKWAVGCGLMEGSNGALNPQGNATRAEIATMLMRFCENVAK